MTLNLPKKQVNAILVALDAEIQYQFESGGKPDWEYYPEVAAMLMAYTGKNMTVTMTQRLQ